MDRLKGKKIIVGITGGIAAYKIPLLIRYLVKEGAEVQVVMSDFAKAFVTPLTLSTVSGKPVLSSFFDEKNGEWNSHVDLGLWADAIIVAPLTANTMAKMAVGIADNLLTTTILSARCPVFYAPTMDLDMFHHAVTQENIKKLKKLGYIYIPPDEGDLASGLKGAGRLKEPEELANILIDFFSKKKTLSGKRVLISAGPTYEPIDPVRFIGNRSSGKMGIALAHAFIELGAVVDLVIGPVAFPVKEKDNLNLYFVETAAQMELKCSELFPKSDVSVMAAAVSDFTPKNPAKSKIKKETSFPKIELVPTVDILAKLGKIKKSNQILIGFALETDNELNNARHKLKRKNLDMIVMNSLKDFGAGFGVDTNKVTLIFKDNNEIEIPLNSKEKIAQEIVGEIKKMMQS